MNKLAFSLGLGLVLSSACMAQIKIDGDDGTSVTIGPGGINVQAPSGGTNLNISPRGVTGVAGGNTHLNVTPGAIRTGSGVYSTDTQKSTSGSYQHAVGRTQTGDALTLTERVNQLEVAVSGKTNPGMSLIARVEKLEMDNLGKRGTGTLKDRVEALAKTLGITFRDPATRTASPATTAAPPAAGSTTAATAITGQGETTGSASGQLIVSSSGQNLSYKINGGSAVVAASNSRIRLSGPCDKLVIDGSDNDITADNVKMIIVNGATNRVTWSKGSTPQIVDSGRNNQLTSR